MALKLDPLGGPLGKLLGDGLEALAQQKLQDLTQRSLKPLQQMQQQQPQQQMMAQQPMQQKLQQPKTYTEGLNTLLNPEQKVEEFRIPEGLKQSEAKQLADVAQKRQAAEAKHRNEIAQAKANIRKEKQKYMTAIQDKGKAAKNSDLRLNRMEELIKKRNLPSANFYSVLSGLQEAGNVPYIGGVLGALAKPFAVLLRSSLSGETLQDLEEYDKLTADFVKEAKPYFGNKVTDTDLRAYMKTIPTLSQTNPGKLAIMKNMRIANAMDKVLTKSLKQVLNEHKDEIPENLERLVNKKAKPRLDKLAEKFNSNIENIPEHGYSFKGPREKARESLEGAIENYISPGLANLVRKIP